MTVGFTPVDAEARRLIGDDLDATLFVEASAGTGKTTSLVQRVTNLVSTGRATLNRVAAITFTEAAAAELRDRIRARLETTSTDETLGEAERNRCRQGIIDLDQADICTLHAFAGGLLRERPLEAGLPPAFETSDEIVANIKFNEQWDSWLDLHLEGDTDLGPHLELALIFGMTLTHIKAIAMDFHQNYGDLFETPFAATPYPTPEAARRLAGTADELDRLCHYSRLGSGDQLYDHVQDRLRTVRRLCEATDGSPTSYRLLQRLLPIRRNLGRQGDWGTDPATGANACTALKGLLSDLDQAASGEIEQVRRVALVPILDNLRAFAIDYAQQRRSEGRAEFHDLLVWSRELLRSNLAVRDYFRRRYSHLLIDEAQDTDPIQADIAMLLAEAVSGDETGSDRARDWRQITPEAGKLFVVGDPKQSIYRFRRADVEQMKFLQQRLEQSGGRTIKLTQNFRSQKPVVGWVNHLFEQWLGDNADDADGERISQASYEAMSARWEAETGSDFRPRVWALSDETIQAGIDAIRQVEANDIGMLLRQMVSDSWVTLDREATEASGQETYRPVRFSDICILIPRRTGLAILQRGLEDWDIPYRLESASLVFETQEIRDLLNCLQSIDNPANQVATVAALRSTAFGCSDVDLLQHLDQGGRFDYLSDTPTGGAGPVHEALGVLRAFHRSRIWESTQALVDRFIRERQLMEVATGHPRMREQWRRYRFMVEQAARFANAGGGPMGAFLNWVDDQINERARVTENPVPESDEEAVRVMTIHGAKGLEFPVVILTGINSSPSRRSNPVIFDRSRGRVAVGVGQRGARFSTPDYEDLSRLDNQMSDAEEVRLMYVATTRARDHLVLSLRRPQRGGNSMADLISGYMVDGPELWESVELKPAAGIPPALPQRADDGSASDDGSPPSMLAVADWKAERESMIARLSRPSFVAATALSRHAEDDKPEPTDPEPWRRGRAGTSVGRAVHAVLQSIDLTTGNGVDHRSSSQAVAEGIPDRETEIARLVRVALGSDIVRRAVASGRVWREVPVAAPVGDGALHGFIDLLFEEPDGLVVVDYKTDAVDDAHFPDSMQRYRLQGGAYAHAVNRITGRPVKEMVFLYLQPDREVALPDLPGAMEEARAAAHELLASQE